MRTSVAIAAALMVPVLAYPAAAASLPGTDILDDAVEDIADGADETLEDTTDTAGDAVGDVTDTATDTVDDVTNTATDTVEDTVDTATEAVEDTTDTATDAVEDTVDTAGETVRDATDGLGTAPAPTPRTPTTTPLPSTTIPQPPTTAPQASTTMPEASISPVPGALGGTGGTAGVSGTGRLGADAGSAGEGAGVGRSGLSGSPAPSGASGLLQPDGLGSPSRLFDSPGSRSAAIGAQAPTPGRPSTGSGSALADSQGMLVATVRFGDGRAPLVSHVNFDRSGDTTFVTLFPTSGTPLTGPDDNGSATGEFRGLVSIAGEEPFRADVRLIVRDDGLVLLVTPLRPLSVTQVLSRMVERLSSTGLALLPIAGLALALLAAGALALVGSRNRRWGGSATASRP